MVRSVMIVQHQGIERELHKRESKREREITQRERRKR